MANSDLVSHVANESLGFCIFSSQELFEFSYIEGNDCPITPYIGKLLGEAYFRTENIYVNGKEPIPLKKITETKQYNKVRSQIAGNEDKPPNEHWMIDAIEYFKLRKKGHDKASGIFPLFLRRQKEAIPIPFLVTESSSSTVFDCSNQPCEIPAWSSHLLEIREYLDQPLLCLKILIPLGPAKSDIGGASLMLPVVLASRETLSSPSGMSFLSSGKISDGMIRKIGAFDEKLQLATAMGLNFISAGSDGVVNWPVPLDKEELNLFLQRWDEFHDQICIQSLKVPEVAIALVERWSDKVEFRKLSSEKLVEFFQASIRSIESSSKESIRNEAWRAKLCLGRSLNHLGEIDQAASLLNEVTSNLKGHQCPELIKSMTSHSVSLASQGMLGQAEQSSRDALDFSRKLMSGTRVEKLVEEVRALGCLGGTVLYQQGAWDKKKRGESRKLLEEALVTIEDCLERERGSNKDELLEHWAMDFCQLNQWHAYYEPSQFLGNFQGSLDKLVDTLGKPALQKHSPYLVRSRWLAAMRLIFQGEKNVGNWQEWDLPHPFTKDQEWLLALSLKSRGLLLCCNNKEEQAELAFNRAFSILQNQELGKLPLLMAGSVCLVAKVFLDSRNYNGSQHFERIGRSLLEALRKDGFCKDHPRLSPDQWLESFNEAEISRTPQQYFVY